GIRPRAQASARTARDRQELLSHALPARGRLPGGRAGRIRPALGAPPPVDPDRRDRGVRPGARSRDPGLVGELRAESPLPRGRERKVRRGQQQVGAVRAGARSDLASLLPTLTGVRTVADTPTNDNGAVPLSMRFGLYQGGRLEAASDAAYRRMLQDTFLPSLASYLEQYLRQDVAGSQDELYEALKTYLMLYDPKHLDPEAVWRWYQTRGEPLLGDDAGPKALKAHFDALYDRGWIDPIVPRNDAVIAKVRGVIGSDSLPNRVYGRLKRAPNQDLREFTVTDKAGPKAMLVFERQSKQPLTKGVPGLYTKDGYHKYFILQVDASTVQLAEEESWVLGSSRGAGTSTPSFAEAVKRLYLEDYRRIWRQYIGDITVVHNRDFTRLVEITRVLSAQDTPLK